MASTNAKAVRRADALQRLAVALDVEQADLHGNARGDNELAAIMTLERLANALESRLAEAKQAGTLATVVAGASVAELAALPGVGDVTAKRIKKAAEDS